jgi:hypothetical protein
MFSVPVTCVTLGAWLVAAGLGIRGRVEPVAGWPQTTGWVAGFRNDTPAGAKQPAYAAVIAFRVAGHVVTFSAPGADDLPRVGAPVRVTYDPRNPADAHDLSLGSYWVGQIYLGAGFLVLGVALMTFWLVFLRRKWARRAGGVFSGQREGRHVRRT